MQSVRSSSMCLDTSRYSISGPVLVQGNCSRKRTDVEATFGRLGGGQIPERISKLVFIDAAVLLNGEIFATNLVGQPGQLGFTGFASYPFFPYALNIGSTGIPDFRGRVDLFVWEDLLMSDFRGNNTLIYDTYAKVRPEGRHSVQAYG
jgi:hypothetical protein